jgi:hypothetical protein
VTYRDDHDAALARADALQAELERAEAERDRLRVKVDELEHGLVPASPGALVPLTTAEVSALVRDVDNAIGMLADRRAGRFVWSIAALVALVPMYFAGLSITVLIVTASLALLGLMQAPALHGAAARAVRNALCDAPETITTIRELEQSLGMHWIAVSTATDTVRLPIREPAPLISRLVRRCPNAVRT